MKSRRHRNGSVPFSLFSFQDIITGVSGIMIFILLILSLELIISKENSEAEAEKIKKTLFADDPLKVFVAGKLEIANSHTAMTHEEIKDLYLQDGESFFQLNKQDGPSTDGTDGTDSNESSESPNNSESTKENPNDQAAAEKPVKAPPAIPSGDPQVDEALQLAFKWLKDQQNLDGSWDKTHQYGITGLVVLAYLTYKKKTRSSEFDSTLEKAIEFLMVDNKCKPGIEKFAYQNAIKTFALAEAAGLLGYTPKIEKAVKESIQYIVDGQQTKGGFAYKYAKNNTQDLSLTAWNLQALNSADKVFVIPQARQGIEKALPWLAAMAKETFTYNTRNHVPSSKPDKEPKNQSMRAIGTWLTILLDNTNRENVKDELDAIATENYENLSWSTTNGHPFYGWYYANLCMTDLGGEEGEKWKVKLRNLMVYNQQKAGYWLPIKYKHGKVPIYSTAFCALMLVSGHKDPKPQKDTPQTDSPATKEPASNPVASNTSDKPITDSTKTSSEKSNTPSQVSAGTSPTTNVNNNSEQPSGTLQGSEPDLSDQSFDNLISLDRNKAAEIKKRLSVFRRSVKSDSNVRAGLEELDLNSLNASIVQSLNRKYFLEAQLNKMNEDPFVHDEEVLKNRYVFLNKEVAKLIKKIDEYASNNSEDLVLNPIKIYLDSKEFNIRLHDGQSLRFSSSVDGIKDFKAWLQSKDKLKDVLIIAIKPSGVKNYRQIDSFIRYLNFKTSIQPVDENTEAN